MAIRVVRLGTPRASGEGLRIGTVRHPPRGVPRQELARRDFYDVWLPELAPSAVLVKAARASLADGDARAWRAFERRYRGEMNRPEARRLLDLLAALSRTASLAVGCYCADPQRCHRSILAAMLVERGAQLVAETG